MNFSVHGGGGGLVKGGYFFCSSISASRLIDRDLEMDLEVDLAAGFALLETAGVMRVRGSLRSISPSQFRVLA